ncbi:transglycosylase family protein [Streptomyces sp. NBC_00094]|uniref:transglycosylase family protein n=1 Tax=Streptomyces sp. NBC_00094 TaxID=2903620 RepID=UPI00225427A4|nr:transglycosylase family protein [Streptomyces sp. NBC_00094]MCX5391137.1 transglycosylase family protein [Streptomyces sp. NBC_00094]
MRSGNGRHRRPRQAPAIVVAAGVTGSAMALPLLATGSASAADSATWDRVAECESGGQWSANFGNGMYGGLQFTQDSWERNGGLAYAPSPDLASRAQQIAVADRALAAGSTDWATCAPIAGLRNDGKATGVDPGPATATKAPTGPVAESNRTAGVPVTPEEVSAAARAAESAVTTAPTGSAASPGTVGSVGSGQASKDPAATVVPVTPATPVSPTAPVVPVTPGTPSDPGSTTSPTTPATPDASLTPGTPGTSTGDTSSATPGTGKHRGEAAPDETGATGATGTSPESGRHASEADKSAESSATASTPDGVTNAGATDSQDASGAYTVRPGDNLSEIAQENELPGGWNALYDANRGTVGADPNLIVPGQSLDLTNGSAEQAG